VHAVEEPSIVALSRGQRAWAAKRLPVRFWHSRQWQIEIRTGSPVTVTRNCPQEQDAVRVVSVMGVRLLPRRPNGERRTRDEKRLLPFSPPPCGEVDARSVSEHVGWGSAPSASTAPTRSASRFDLPARGR